MCFLSTCHSTPCLNIMAAAPTFPSMHDPSEYTFISWVSFLIFSIAMLLLSGICVGYLGGHFGLVLIGLIFTYSLGLILNACSSSWSSALCFFDVFFGCFGHVGCEWVGFWEGGDLCGHLVE